ncbi:amino acid permease [Candidatus Woesearchaeota archaeon]|nr:amino acid permease [Candidatus Woesearchaeota archaeon]MBT4110722.1 amino acid permease [Candidatus Woesearchaeota archaeon]MBT4336318.1 amino acid permease [Candidatus Woesearchaeota archaeon]MBT4469321.1 amino acid permease [Candidatus Woesearchaeota archaeon]MBT6743856.1 amino acid permease [Candidatus Woesearchaeota archaeon]
MAQLKKVLSYPAILLITINSIMGTGIFFLPAVGAGAAGPASLLSWIILSIISIYIAMCFGELASMFPKSGGIYEYCKQAYGRFFSFIIGWMTVVAGNVTIAMLVVGAVQYLLPLGAIWMKIAISLLFIFAFNYIAFKGMKTSAVMLVVFAFITLAAILGLTIPGLFKFNVGNFKPFFIFPASSLVLAIFLIAETFFGWETATFLAEETKDGQRVMPKALIWGTVIIAIICILFVVTSLGVMPWNIFGSSATPLTDLGILHYGGLGGDIFTILVYLAIIGSVAGWVVSAPRLLLAMAKDKLFLDHFAKIHKKNLTPHRAILFQTILTTILVIVGAGSYTTMLHLLVPIVLVAYSFVLVSVVVLRYKKPDQKRFYTAPFGKVGPIIIALFMLFLIYMWMTHTPGALDIVKVALSLIFLGVPLYFLVEMYHDAKAIYGVNEKLSYILVLFENIFFPISIKKRILLMLGDVKNKNILEFGCSVGTLTRKLSQKVLPKGRVYAFDFIEHNVRVALSHMKRHGHVNFYHHKHLDHFKTTIKLPKMDALVSTGSLSYMQKPQNVLNHLGKHVKKGGRVVFLDYDQFFFFIPNVPWISDEKKLKKMFKIASFEVEVIKKRGLLWRHIFIHGKKV